MLHPTPRGYRRVCEREGRVGSLSAAQPYGELNLGLASVSGSACQCCPLTRATFWLYAEARFAYGIKTHNLHPCCVEIQSRRLCVAEGRSVSAFSRRTRNGDLTSTDLSKNSELSPLTDSKFFRAACE
jgi:hypothetical protein